MLPVLIPVSAWLVIAAASAWAACVVAFERRRSLTEGIILGASLGPLGLAVEVLLPAGEGFREEE